MWPALYFHSIHISYVTIEKYVISKIVPTVRKKMFSIKSERFFSMKGTSLKKNVGNEKYFL